MERNKVWPYKAGVLYGWVNEKAQVLSVDINSRNWGFCFSQMFTKTSND
jgi:hypothetical protein